MIDANTHVLSSIIISNVGVLKPDIVANNLETHAPITTENNNLLTSVALVIMDPYELEDLMLFVASVSLNGFSAKADTLIDTTTSLNCVSTECGLANGFYKACKTAPKMAIRVASEQRISTTKVFYPSVFTKNEHAFSDLQFRSLPHFKSLDIVLRLTALKQLGVSC